MKHVFAILLAAALLAGPLSAGSEAEVHADVV